MTKLTVRPSENGIPGPTSKDLGELGPRGSNGVRYPEQNASEVKKIKNSPERKTAITTAFANVEKLWGKGALIKMGDKPIEKIDVIPTGCLSLDYALGVGGIPKGRTIEIFGPEMSGKTTLCLQLAAQVHKAGGNVAFVDVEHGLDLQYAENLGVNVPELMLSQPDFGEQALSIVEELVKSGATDLILVDSVAALIPRAEVEGEMGDPSMAVQARLMGQAMRKLTPIIGKTNTVVVFTNQLRMKIGVMFGNPETTTGGNALKFYASVRLDVRRIESIKDKETIIGNKTRIKVVKNKVAPPFKEAIVDIIFGKGIDVYADIVSLGVFSEIIKKSGSWYSYKEDRIGQGAATSAEFLKANTGIYQSIFADIKAKLFA